MPGWYVVGMVDEDAVDTVQEISDAEVEAAVARTLDDIGIDLDTLRKFAQRGRFDTEKQRRAWFLISGLLGDAVREEHEARAERRLEILRWVAHRAKGDTVTEYVAVMLRLAREVGNSWRSLRGTEDVLVDEIWLIMSHNGEIAGWCETQEDADEVVQELGEQCYDHLCYRTEAARWLKPGDVWVSLTCKASVALEGRSPGPRVTEELKVGTGDKPVSRLDVRLINDRIVAVASGCDHAKVRDKAEEVAMLLGGTVTERAKVLTEFLNKEILL